MAAPAIETHGLTKLYGDVAAVADLDLEVVEGEVFGYLGPNGAGKTTTIRLLLDLIRPTSGTARVLGMDARTDAVEIHRHTGYLPGDLALYTNLTGEELIRYFANIRGGVEWSRVTDLADRFDADLSRRIGEYSSGNRQKVGLIQAFMHRPRLLVLDEPSTGLDPLVQQAFQGLVREVVSEGSTVFLSSHTLSEVERVADRVGIIRQGRLTEVEGVQSLKQRAVRQLQITFAHDVPADIFAGVDGVREAAVDGAHARVSFDGGMESLLRVAMAHDVVDLQSVDADLEEIFLDYYRVDA